VDDRVCLHLVRITPSPSQCCLTCRECVPLVRSVGVQCDCVSNMDLLENVAENFGAVFRENQFWVNQLASNFCGDLKEMKCGKRITTLEELRNIRSETTTLSGDQIQRINDMCHRYTECIR
jgi:hypothetical protein